MDFKTIKVQLETMREQLGVAERATAGGREHLHVTDNIIYVLDELVDVIQPKPSKDYTHGSPRHKILEAIYDIRKYTNAIERGLDGVEDSLVYRLSRDMRNVAHQLDELRAL